MKRILKALVFTSLFLAVSTVSGFAATTGNIALSGTVSSILEITITPDAGNASLPLTTDVTDRAVASVNERTNNRLGYTVTLTATNAVASSGSSALKGAVSTDSLPYTIKYGGSAVSFDASKNCVVSNVNAKTTSAGTDKAVTISFSGSGYFLDADTYSDTLTLTIAAK